MIHRRREAVRTFQRIFGLAADGVVGKATWYKMVYLYVGITQLAELVSEGQLFQTFSFQYPGLLRQGDRGGDVAVLQYMLALVAEFEPTVSAIRIDGVYGSDTARAVREYQAHVGLPADGIVGPQTWYSIYGEFTGIERDLRRDGINFPQNESVPAAAVRYGTTSRAGQFPGRTSGWEAAIREEWKWYDATGIGGGNAVQSGAESSVYAPPPGDAVQLSAPAGDRRAVWRGDAGGGDALSAGAGPAGDRCGGRPHLGRHTAGMDGAGAGSGPTQKPAHFPRRGRADAAWRGRRSIWSCPKRCSSCCASGWRGSWRMRANGQHGDASVQNTLWLQNLAQLEETGVMDRATWDMLSRLYELFITAGSGSGTAAHQNLT